VIDSSIMDGVVVDRHVEAAARYTRVQQVPLFVTQGGSPSGFRIDIVVDADDPVCEANVIGVTRTTTAASGDIATAKIVYCQSRWARDLNTVVHELGHVLGLQHSPSQADVMYCYAGRGVETPSASEIAILSLLDARRSGTRFPDNDRNAQGASLAGSQQIICPAGPF
jgi:hypothetical protein